MKIRGMINNFHKFLLFVEEDEKLKRFKVIYILSFFAGFLFVYPISVRWAICFGFLYGISFPFLHKFYFGKHGIFTWENHLEGDEKLNDEKKFEGTGCATASAAALLALKLSKDKSEKLENSDKLSVKERD